MTQPIIVTINVPALQELIKDAVKQALLESEGKAQSYEYISRNETAVRLHISLPTLNNYTKTGKIPAYRIGGRVLYKLHEVEQSLRKIQTRL